MPKKVTLTNGEQVEIVCGPAESGDLGGEITKFHATFLRMAPGLIVRVLSTDSETMSCEVNFYFRIPDEIEVYEEVLEMHFYRRNDGLVQIKSQRLINPVLPKGRLERIPWEKQRQRAKQGGI